MTARMAVAGDNEAPGLLSLLDEALDGADLATIRTAFDMVVDRLAVDDPARQAERDLLLGVVGRWDAERPEIQNEDHASKATDLSRRLKRAIDAEESARKQAKDPFLSGGRRIDATFTARREPLETGRKGIDGRLSRWLAKQEAERRAREAEAQRQREEAERAAREAAEAAAKAADDADARRKAEEAEEMRRAAEAMAERLEQQRTQVRSAGGAVAATTKHYRVEVVNFATIPREFLILDEKRALVELKAGRVISGLKLVEEVRASVRG